MRSVLFPELLEQLCPWECRLIQAYEDIKHASNLASRVLQAANDATCIERPRARYSLRNASIRIQQASFLLCSNVCVAA